MSEPFHEVGRLHLTDSERTRASRLSALIDHMVQDTVQRQRAAVEMMLPVAAARMQGVLVLTASDGSWRVTADDRLDPWTIGHQPVETLAAEPEERSTHAG